MIKYFFNDLELFSSNTALILKDKTSLSYAELADLADNFLKKLPSEKKLVLIEMANELDPIIAYLACLRGNHPAMLVYPENRELTAQIKEAYAPDIVYEKSDGKFVLHYNLNNNVPSNHFSPELALLLSSSGSTGSPKYIRLSADNLNANAQSIVEYLNLDVSQKTITNLPLHYSYGLSILNSHLASGASIVVTDESMIDDSFWELFKRENITSFAGVPYVYEMLDRTGFYEMALPSLQYFTQAGGKLRPELVKKFAQYAKDTRRRFYVMYGQTEATARIAYMPSDKILDYPNCMGIPIPRGKIKLYDGKKEIKKIDTPGEIVYNGPNVMMGYALNRDDLSLPSQINELKTGDIACYNKEGLYYIVGRKSRFLKLFGQRINLDEVESHLRRQGKSVICGGTDQQLVVLTTDKNELKQIKDLIISSYKLLANIVTVIQEDEIPLLPSGKPDYAKLSVFAKRIVGDTDITNKPKNIFKKIVSFFYTKEASPNHSIKECFMSELGYEKVADDDCFLTLNGDSLRYVSLSVKLQKSIGFLPNKWESITIKDLEEAALNKELSSKKSNENAWNSINYFRAIAIFSIVLAHTDLIAWNINTKFEKIIMSFVRDNTILFFFISGFIFYHFSENNFKYRKFIIGKIKNLVIPYLILSISIIIIQYCLNGSKLLITGYEINSFKSVLSALIKGTALVPYWFVPFMFIMFLMTPLFIRFTKLRTSIRNILLLLLLAAALIIHRPWNLWNPIQNLIHYTPVYLLGIISSKYKADIYNYLKNKSLLLLIFVIGCSILQVFINGRSDNDASKLFEYNGIDYQLIQKICMCYFLMIFLHKYENIKSPILDLLASTSFAVYFLHYWFIYFTYAYLIRHPSLILPEYMQPVMWILYAFIFTAFSILIALLIKKVFPSKSKYITGY
ncbi:AMP-binding protein [Confluentibacter sediminis]|uniref:AMP-binding protein n=1 Tax=Confluentibacter sediminis TaxID=2219045 RepID=UPI000DAC2E89|nr:AMP-binding protein [Confluentibacter sediminis]